MVFPFFTKIVIRKHHTDIAVAVAVAATVVTMEEEEEEEEEEGASRVDCYLLFVYFDLVHYLLSSCECVCV